MNRFGGGWIAIVAIAGGVGAAPAGWAAEPPVSGAGGDFGPRVAPPENLQTNLCTEQLVMGDPQRDPSWNGWGNGPTNTRYQPKAQGKLTAADLPRLQLKWAFGYANVMSARS